MTRSAMIVVDAAAVVDALVGANEGAGLRDELVDRELHTPALLDFEVVSALRGLTIGGHLSGARALDALEDFDDLAIERWASSGALRRRAFSLRDNLSAYDAGYVALAEALACPFLTRDARLARASGHDAEILVR